MMSGLVMLTEITAANVVANVFGKARPRVVAGEKINHFCMAWVTGNWQVMVVE